MQEHTKTEQYYTNLTHTVHFLYKAAKPEKCHRWRQLLSYRKLQRFKNPRHGAGSHFRVGIGQGRRMLKLKQAGASSKKISTTNLELIQVEEFVKPEYVGTDACRCCDQGIFID